jgi:hypothetical protein
MQMGKTRLTVDVMGMPARRGGAGIDRLSALSDQHQLIDRAAPQWSENVLPWLRQATITIAKCCRN